MKNTRSHLFILGAILLISAILRFWNLGTVPVGPNWDEAALGYNAYSLLKTGKDEYGTWLPLSLRSYDDYKPPLYTYLTIPSVFLFGLNLWSVRLPAAINGILAVLGTFILARSLFLLSEKLKNVTYLPYVSAFLLALSPWHIQFSRIAFEANIGVTINIWAIAAFLIGLKKRWLLSLSAFLFALSLYAYHSQRIFAPFMVVLLAFSFRKKLFVQKEVKSIVLAVVVGMITLLPLIPVFFDPTTLTRLRGTSSLSDQTGLLRKSVERLERDQEAGNYIGLVANNRRMVYAQTVLEGYLSHFSLKWLFLQGDNARHHAPGVGLLYLIELPFLLLGILTLFALGGMVATLLFGWFIIAPIAASPTTELPHAIRTLVFLPSFQIVLSLGLWTWFEWIKKRKAIPKIALSGFLIFMVIGNFTYFLVQYFVHQNLEFSQYWQYGYKEATAYVKEHYEEFDKIIVSTKLEQPHMFFLFYLQYDPKKYLEEGGTASGGFEEEENAFDKFEFRPIHWDQEIKDNKTLYIGTPMEIYSSVKKTNYYLNGEEAVRISY